MWRDVLGERGFVPLDLRGLKKYHPGSLRDDVFNSGGPLTTVASELPPSRTQTQSAESGLLLFFSVFCGVLRFAAVRFRTAFAGTWRVPHLGHDGEGFFMS